MGRAWDSSALRAWVCRCQRLQPIGRSSQRRNLRARLTWLLTSERQFASDVRRPAAELNRRVFPHLGCGTGFRQAFKKQLHVLPREAPAGELQTRTNRQLRIRSIATALAPLQATRARRGPSLQLRVSGEPQTWTQQRLKILTIANGLVRVCPRSSTLRFLIAGAMYSTTGACAAYTACAAGTGMMYSPTVAGAAYPSGASEKNITTCAGAASTAGASVMYSFTGAGVT